MKKLAHLAAIASLLSGASALAQSTSLYNPATYQPLTSDLRPRKAGDLITVMVYETASASSSAGTSGARDAGIGIGVHSPHTNTSGSLSTHNQSDGRGRTERAGRVLAQITVPIREVTASGDLIIAGEQVLDINDERQQIRLEGRVRPQDVSDTNVVLSTRVANAKISYAGQGDVADRQRAAWWQRFLTLFGI
jgi:flagellar L-ring protein precursor FlgH